MPSECHQLAAEDYVVQLFHVSRRNSLRKYIGIRTKNLCALWQLYHSQAAGMQQQRSPSTKLNYVLQEMQTNGNN